MRISTKRSSIDGDISLLMIYLEHCQKQEKTFKSKLDLVAKLPQQGKVCFDNDKVLLSLQIKHWANSPSKLSPKCLQTFDFGFGTSDRSAMDFGLGIENKQTGSILGNYALRMSDFGFRS